MIDPLQPNSPKGSDSEIKAILAGRPVFSIEQFRAVAREVADQLGKAVAICHRPETEGGASTIPYVNKPLKVAQEEGHKIIEVVQPSGVSSSDNQSYTHELQQHVREALNKIPGKEELESYFGISSRRPEQPADEGERSDQLIAQLRVSVHSMGEENSEESSEGSKDTIAPLLEELARGTENSGADVDALRALMRGSRKSNP